MPVAALRLIAVAGASALAHAACSNNDDKAAVDPSMSPEQQAAAAANTPVTAQSPPNEWVHHPRLGLKLKQAMDKLGIECHVQYKGGPPIKAYRGVNDFLVKKLTGK